jgi:hypothetical protein
MARTGSWRFGVTRPRTSHASNCRSTDVDFSRESTTRLNL